MRTIIIWGAGRIGRGFVADIFEESDEFKTVFVDIDSSLVNALNENGRYLIAKATKEGIKERYTQKPFEAVHTSDTKRLEELFKEPNLLLDIAVHEPKLIEVAAMVAPLIELRAKTGLPMDIMMNVNMARPDKYFKNLLSALLFGESLKYFNEKVGVTGIFAMCISPLAPDWLKEKDKLALWNNGYFEQAISAECLKCPPPNVPRLRLTSDIEREETRKLYTLNMAHAFLCYMGLPLGLKTSCEAVKDRRLRPLLCGALDESIAGLKAEYGFGLDEMLLWRKTIIDLLENPYIEDDLQRLGADSRRKLAPKDRLCGPAALCEKIGIRPHNLMKAIRAGFEYENDDEGTREVRGFYLKNGLEAAMQLYCGRKP